MTAMNDTMHELEDFLFLMTKWSVLLCDNLSSDNICTTSQPQISQSQSYSFGSNPTVQLSEAQIRIKDDYKSDLAHIERSISNITLQGEGKIACSDLVNIASILQLSHISFSTVTEVLVGLQETQAVAKILSSRLDKG